VAQIVTRIDDELLSRVDLVISWDDVQNRSDFVRQAIVELVDRRMRQQVGQRIVEGYRHTPQTDAEVAGADAAALAMILEEPW
jgi:metal-responsive CopG/Arc/MetJ family transcriptional regulator